MTRTNEILNTENSDYRNGLESYLPQLDVRATYLFSGCSSKVKLNERDMRDA